MIAIRIPGDPVPFARAGANGKRRYTPPKQASFMGVVKLFAQRAMAGAPPMKGPVEMQVRATYLVPKSWPKKRQAEARWKDSTPDLDNLHKILADAMNAIVFEDDAQIASLTVQKVYGPVAEIVVSVQSLGPQASVPVDEKPASLRGYVEKF